MELRESLPGKVIFLMDGFGEVRPICEVRAGGESPAEHTACAKAWRKNTKCGKEIMMAQT